MRGTWRHVPSARHSRAVLSSLADAISPPAVAAALHTAAHGCQKLRISVDMHSAEDACRLRHSRSEMMCVNGFSQEVQRLAENMETAPVDESCVAAERGDWVAAHGPDLQRAIVRRRHKTELGHQAEAPAPQRTIPSVISAHKLPTRFTCHSPAGTLHHMKWNTHTREKKRISPTQAHLTVSPWPTSVFTHADPCHILTVLSLEPDSRVPSGSTSRHCTGPSCPSSTCDCPSLSHTRMVLRGRRAATVTVVHGTRKARHVVPFSATTALCFHRKAGKRGAYPAASSCEDHQNRSKQSMSGSHAGLTRPRTLTRCCHPPGPRRL